MCAFVCSSCDQNYSTKQRLLSHLESSVNLSCGKTENGQHQLEQLTMVKPNGDKPHVCRECSMAFSTKFALRRHEQQLHGITQTNRECELVELRKRIEALSGRVDNIPLTQVINIKNNNLNIHINGLGKEDLSRVTHGILTECLRQLPDGNKGILDLVKLIHFETKGNKNIKCVTGDKSGLVMTYFDDEQRGWVVDDKKKVLHQMLKGPRSLLNDHFNTNLKDFEQELTSALYNFIKFWFKDTKNKRSGTYDDITCRLHEMIQRLGEEIMGDIREEKCNVPANETIT